MLLFQFLEVESGWYSVKKILFYQKCLECDFRLIWIPKKFCFGQFQSRGGGGPEIGTQSQICLGFFVTSPLILTKFIQLLLEPHDAVTT